MKVLHLKDHKNICVRLQKNENLVLQNVEILQSELKATDTKVPAINAVSVELQLPQDADYYGLLGAEFIADESENTLTIEVCYNHKQAHKPYYNNLSLTKEMVFVGLQKEYAAAVLCAAVQYFQKNNTYKGKLRFSMAAHCLVGSSEKMFSNLTQLLLRLLGTDKDSLTDDKKLAETCDIYWQDISPNHCS